jgi:hypothetical protein
MFHPIPFIEKLSALVPTPRAHLVRFHGLLGPAAKWRPLIIPHPPPPASEPPPEPESISTPEIEPRELTPNPSDTATRVSMPPAPEKRRRNYSWAELMKRVFQADVLACATCGGRLQIVATIHPPEITRKILDHLGLPSRPPPLAPPALQQLPFCSE